MIFEAITTEDTNPHTITTADDEQREGYQRVRKVYLLLKYTSVNYLKVIVTPTRTIYVVPEMMMLNRVLRRFDPDGTNVLRVAFRSGTSDDYFHDF